MNNLVRTFMLVGASAVIAILVGAGCGKKKGGEVAAGCAGGYSNSPAFGQCLHRGSCPQGTVVSPSQPSTCIDPQTGSPVSSQICGAGYHLTANGCYQQGPCPPGQALYGNDCIAIVQPSGGYPSQNYGGYPSQYGGYPSQYGGYQQQYPYGNPYNNPYGYSYSGNQFYYRPY